MPETIELILTGMAAGGEAVGRDADSGKIVFVADAIPGERVRVEIVEDRNRWLRARLLAVLDGSPDRIVPPCPYYGPPQPVTFPDGRVLNAAGERRCAGCRWQHIAYERQLALKREIVLDQLQRLGGDEQGVRDASLVAETIALGDPDSPSENAVLDYGYLIQARFVLDPQGRLCLPGRDGQPLPVDACLLLHPQLSELHAAFQVDEEEAAGLDMEFPGVDMGVSGAAPHLIKGRDGLLILDSAGDQAPAFELDLPVSVLLRQSTAEGEELSPLVGDWGYQIAVAGRRLTVYPSPAGQQLFWPHVVGNEALAVIAAEMLGLQIFEGLLDLWAGVGTVTVTLAGRAGTVLAVEEDPLAIAALEINCNDLENVAIFRGEPLDVLPELARRDYRADTALVQIPQGQVNGELLARIGELGVRRVAVITDNLAGLARSIHPVREAGFALVRIQPVDLAPQRDVVTLIALFERAI